MINSEVCNIILLEQNLTVINVLGMVAFPIVGMILEECINARRYLVWYSAVVPNLGPPDVLGLQLPEILASKGGGEGFWEL